MNEIIQIEEVEQPKETLQEQSVRKQQEVRAKEEQRQKRLGWTYVQVTGFSNRKMRRQQAKR